MIRRTVQEVVWCIVMLCLLIAAVLVITGCELLGKDKQNVWRVETGCTSKQAHDIRCYTDINSSKEHEFGYGSVGENAVIRRSDEGVIIEAQE